jgi:arsenate reductase (thioredoxin)
MLNEKVLSYCKLLVDDFDEIPAERKHVLSKITNYITSCLNENRIANLVYICTHNSRRSHFGQIWSKIAAEFYRIKGIQTFSGGTETTAFHPNAIAALNRAGFVVSRREDGINPFYEVNFGTKEEPIVCFSKVYHHHSNPQTKFAAIMTCGDAEENCPFIPGVELRIATTYEDPKIFDNTSQEEDMYDERCRQIAQECLFVFSNVKL